MSQAVPDCTPKCRSPRHADEVMAALTGGSEGRLRAFLTAHCHNAATLRDASGRTALHLAASLGKRALLEWLLENRGADMTVKDKESGWTALHRSVFYGHIHCLMALVKVGLSVWPGGGFKHSAIRSLSNMHGVKLGEWLWMCFRTELELVVPV